MSGKKPRIKVSFEKDVANFLKHIAKVENKSLAQVIRELALLGLEIREDLEGSRQST